MIAFLLTQIAKLKNAVSSINSNLTTKFGKEISQNTDLNNLKTPGLYYSASASITDTLSHTPVTGYNFVMLVESKGGSNLTQMIIADKFIYTRTTTGGVFESWYKFEGTSVQ